MVYGPMQTPPPVKVDHPRVPIGEYSASKKALEDYCIGKRAQGLRVSIFRPRLINGPGRVGILGMLFNLIRLNMPVPLIGSGANRYQMVSVFDCASAASAPAEKGVVNGEFNLGSVNPPTVRGLLGEVIRQAGSKSILIPTIAAPAKVAAAACSTASTCRSSCPSSSRSPIMTSSTTSSRRCACSTGSRSTATST